MDRKLKVLLADDEKLARESMRDYLPWEEIGMERPVCVENGVLALDYLCSHPVDLFIMDIRMPVMDGMALLDEIRDRKLDVLIIVLSAYDQFSYAQKAIQSRKVFEYVLKPIRRASFLGVLEKAAAEIMRRKESGDNYDQLRRLDQLKKEYTVCIIHHQLDEAFVHLKKGIEPWLEAEKETGIDAEEMRVFRHFFVSLYTETQMLLLQQIYSVKEEYRSYGTDSLKRLGSCKTLAEMQEQFYRMVEELRPWLEAGHKEPNKISPVIESCLNEIQKHYTEADFSLNQLAEEMQLNANYLSSRFKSEVGVGFVTYVNTLRIRKAQQLLKDMRYRTNEVAFLVGFDNPKYFTRVFKKCVGLVPSEYRSRIRNYKDHTEQELG